MVHSRAHSALRGWLARSPKSVDFILCAMSRQRKVVCVAPAEWSPSHITHMVHLESVQTMGKYALHPAPRVRARLRQLMRLRGVIVYANMCCLCGRCRVPLVAQHTDTDCALSASNPRHKFVRRKYDYLFKASFAYLCVNVWVCKNMSRCYLTGYLRTHRRSIVTHMYTYTIHPVYKDAAILRSLLICSVVDVAVYKVGSPSVWFRDIVSKIFDWHLRYSAWIRERNA